VPAATSTVSPALASCAALVIDFTGLPEAPEPESLPVVET
jgi:hypothetical protein